MPAAAPPVAGTAHRGREQASPGRKIERWGDVLDRLEVGCEAFGLVMAVAGGTQDVDEVEKQIRLHPQDI